MNLRAAAVLVCIFAAAGCGSAGTGSPEADQSQDAALEPLRTPIVFRRTGGVVGFNDRVEIQPSGETNVTSRLRGPDHPEDGASLLTAEQLDLLHRTLSGAADFTAPPAAGVDRISYSIEYDGRSMRWNDAATPPRLGPALELLRSML